MYARSRSFGFNDVVRGRILAGNYFLSRQNCQRYFMKALKVRRLITEELFTALTPGEVDVLLTPTTPAPAMTFKGFSILYITFIVGNPVITGSNDTV